MSWARLEIPKDTYHIIPVYDLQDHEQINCWCRPKIERQSNGNVILKHNSADMREFFEPQETGH